MIDIQAIILEVADEWDSLEHQDMDTPAAHAVAMATEVAQRAILAEREACAKVCEAMKTCPPSEVDDAERGYNASLRRAAEAIRLRSNAEISARRCDGLPC